LLDINAVDRDARELDIGVDYVRDLSSVSMARVCDLGRERLAVPVVPEFVLIRHPFCELLTVESENVMSVTVLSDFPPTDPMLNPWPPEQVMPVTVIFVPLVTATQSS
jgi:hypothetical protein